ncbi:MAG: LD-carboxypeptidase [Bacteroidales bacterium]|jgi:muramoyltetrapeptide carboxypeptidase|nr:LD-carboxypeptidase [Bacteroidales bacterium]
MITLPKFLKTGDAIALVSTAKKIDFSIVENARKHFENWGVRVVVGESATASFYQFSGDDEVRANDFQTQLDNPNVKAIVCLRGGYGSVRIIDKLDFSEFVKNPKWIVGYSDITVIQNHILKNYNIASLHAEMPLKFPIFPEINESLKTLKDAFFGKFEPLQPQPNALNKTGIAKGELVGGNLAILCNLLGSSSEIDTCGKILFLEDVGEYLYAIDRMMMTLKRAKKLDQLAGLAIGQFTDLQDNEIPFGKTAYEIIAEHVANYDYPVLFDISAGHCEINKPMVFGGVYTMDVSEKFATLNSFIV